MPPPPRTPLAGPDQGRGLGTSSSTEKRRRRKRPLASKPSSSGGTLGSSSTSSSSPPTRREAMDIDDAACLPAMTMKGGKDTLGQAERDMVEEERPLVLKALREFRDRARDVEDKVGALARLAEREVSEFPGPRDEGASFLAVKQTLLLSYCRDICSYAAAKVEGRGLAGGGPAGRLVALRTILEKLRPLDRKLKYQTDKLLRLASTPVSNGVDDQEEADGKLGDGDPLSFRPRPEAMAPRGTGSDAASRAEGKVGGRPSDERASTRTAGGALDGTEAGLYRAPRLASVPYDEDGVARGSVSARDEKRLEKRRDKLRRGEVMETLREEFGDQPEHVRAVGKAGASGVSEAKMKRLLDEDKDRLDFEEEHMVRLTVTRKAKKARRQMEKDAGRLETIADVGSSADFVRVARDADGFGAAADGGDDDDIFGGGGSRGRMGGKKRSGPGAGALGRAMGAVGGSMRGREMGGGGIGRSGNSKGKKRRK